MTRLYRLVARLMAEMRRTAQVLLVEDEEGVANVMRAVLDGSGVEMTWVKSAKEALKILRDQRDAFDLLLIDLGLEDLNGLRLIKGIKDESLAQAPIVLVTGYADAETVIRLNQLGCFSILAKPFRAQVVMELLDSFSVRHRPFAQGAEETDAPPAEGE